MLRLRGLTPFNPSPENFVVEPGGSFYTRHPKLGYTLIPGQFRITLPDGYAFEATHGEDTHRLTHPPNVDGGGGRKGHEEALRPLRILPCVLCV